MPTADRGRYSCPPPLPTLSTGSTDGERCPAAAPSPAVISAVACSTTAPQRPPRVWTDASFGIPKPMAGYVIYLNGTPITWSARKLKIVPQSFVQSILKRTLCLLFWHLKRTARKIGQGEGAHAAAVVADRAFYADWLLPRLKQHRESAPPVR